MIQKIKTKAVLCKFVSLKVHSLIRRVITATSNMLFE